MTEDYFKTAVLHHKTGNWNKAKEIYEYILKSKPNDYLVLQNYALLLSQLGENKQAKNIFEKCLKIKPNDYLLLYNYGKFFHNQKIFDKAIEFYEKSFAIQPNNNLSMYNIGNIHSEKKEYNKSIIYYEKTINTTPSNFLAHNNMGFSYKYLGNFEKAEFFFKKSIEKNPNFVEAHVNYSTTLLCQKKFNDGFEEYEWRKKSKVFTDYSNYRNLKLKTPLLNELNSDINGKKILIFSEQGIGDLIQFSRYMFQLSEKFNAKIILRLKYDLHHFFKSSTIQTISEEDKIPNHDFHQHLLSLPGIFYKKNKSFLKNINFISYNEKKLEEWRNFFKSFPGLKVGINANSTLRSGATGSLERLIPIEEFKVLTDLKNINFFIIERDFNKKNLNIINKNFNVNYFEKLDKNVKPFEDTIGIIKNLDLIITADTSIAHLSSTLEKKTWIALPYVCDWRWFREDKLSVWYTNTILYRQKQDKDWSSTFNAIKKDLEKVNKK